MSYMWKKMKIVLPFATIGVADLLKGILTVCSCFKLPSPFYSMKLLSRKDITLKEAPSWDVISPFVPASVMTINKAVVRQGWSCSQGTDTFTWAILRRTYQNTI